MDEQIKWSKWELVKVGKSTRMKRSVNLEVCLSVSQSC